MSTLFIDPDIRQAKTLPSAFYTDAGFFDRSRESIFARTWQFVGRADEINNLRPATLLPGFLDEPILLARDDDKLRCLSNVCTHRGKILVEQSCEARVIRCSYHGRRFGLDGKFMSMPEFEDVANFPTEDDNLRPVPLASRNGFLFASIDPIADFDNYVGDAARKFAADRYDNLRLVEKREYEMNAHWALYCENYLEGFHIPYVHKGLNAVIDYGSYSIETFRYSSLQIGRDESDLIIARYLFVFPNMMFNFYPWGISVNIVRPVSPDKTIVEFLTYVSDEAKRNTGAGADLHAVELEDEAVVESVQRGIRSRFYSSGRYSPTREQGTHHFHRLIAEFMNR